MHKFARVMGPFVWAGAAAAVGLDEPAILRVIAASDQPIHVVSVRLGREHSHDGSLAIDVENASAKPAWLLEFTIAPTDCPHSDHPVAVTVTYPAEGGRNPTSPVQALNPGARARLTVPESEYRRLIAYQRKAGCPETAIPELTLRAVAFCDGSGWEGLAGGSDHTM